MPTYDYVCDACGHAFELFQSMTAKPERTCPACKKRKLRRLIGTGAAILVGGRSAASESSESQRNSSEPSTSTSTSTDESSSDSSSSGDATPPERKISGSTSTPTHEAREGRGVGNLVDAVRRQRREAESAKPSAKPEKKTSTANQTPPKKASSTSSGKTSKKTSSRSSKTSKTPRKSRPRGGS